jgi:hypothetical protein
MLRCDGFHSISLALIVASLISMNSMHESRADSMPWSGGSSSVDVLGKTSSRIGPGVVSDSESSTFAYHSTVRGDLTTSGTGSADASVNGTATNLLNAGTSYQSSYAPQPSFPGIAPSVVATATWAGDHVVIQPTTGQAMPETVQLNLSVNFVAPPLSGASWSLANISVTYDDKTSSLSIGPRTGYEMTTFDAIQISPYRFPGIEGPNGYSGQYLYRETFHLSLPISALGISDPFTLSLKNEAMNSSGLSGTFVGGYKGVTLSLDRVTLADGATPESEGYALSFASGLISPNPVPEPGVFAILVVGLGAIGAWRIRQRI